LKDEGVEGKLDHLDGKAKKTGATFGGMIGSVAKWGAALAVAVGGIAIASIKDASEAESSLAQLDAVLKSTGGTAGVTRDQLTDLADGLEKTTKFSAESTQAAQALLLTFTNIGSKIFPEVTKTALDMATALGGDAAGQSIALGKALNDPIKGVTALSRVGVSFTDGQKKQIETMQKSGNIMGAQKIILAELAKEFGGSAEAAGKTFAGQLVILQNAMGNVTETLGAALLPKLTQFMTWVTPHLPAIADFFTKTFDVIGEAFRYVGGFVTEMLIPAFDKFWNWIKPNIPSIKEMFKVEFAIIKAEIKFVSDFVTDHVIPTFQLLKQKFDEYFPAIKAAVMKAYDYLKPSFDKLVATIKSDLMPIIMGLWGTVQKAMPGIKAIFEIVFPILVLVVKNVIDGITGLIKVVKGIYDFIKPGLDLVANIFSSVFGGIKKVIDGVQWVLDKFNRTKMNDKSSTVTTTQITNYKSGQMLSSHATPYANGTDNHPGGYARVNELGGEIIDLPSGSRVIPHDVSMEMAKNGKAGGSGGGLTLSIATFINNRKQDVEELMQEMEIYRRMHEPGGA